MAWVTSARIGEAHLDPAGQGGHAGIGALDAAVVADGLDPVEAVGIGDLGRDDVAQGACRSASPPR